MTSMNNWKKLTKKKEQPMQPTDPTNTTKNKMAWLLKFAASVILLLMLISFFIVMAVALYAVSRDGQLIKQPVEQTPAGSLERVSQASREITLVETDMGFYSVAGGVALKKGEPLTMLAFADRSAMLCTSTLRCMPLDLVKNSLRATGGQVTGGQHE